MTAPLALRLLVKPSRTEFSRSGVAMAVCAGVLVGLGTIAVLAATHTGELAIVVVLTALYPGVTTLLARFVLGEDWARSQEIGLATALAAEVLISAGSS